jgi:GT2 family glycosyltransferase
MATVGIVVVTYRSAGTIAACLQSLRTAFSGDCEVVVVDNASDDESGKIAEREGAKVTWLLKNYGYGHGNNAGLRALQTNPDYVVFANPDTVWPAESIDDLLATMKTNPDVGLLSPVLIGEDGTRQAFVERDLTLSRSLLGMTRLRPPVRPEAPDPRVTGLIDVEWLHTAAAVVPMPVVRQIGGFDERFFLFAEDADLCRRIRAVGKRVSITSRVEVPHIGGTSVMNSNSAKEAAALRTRALAAYLDKYEGQLARRAFGAVGTVVYGLGRHTGQAREAWRALTR